MMISSESYMYISLQFVTKELVLQSIVGELVLGQDLTQTNLTVAKDVFEIYMTG